MSVSCVRSPVTLQPVDKDNWREVVSLVVTPEQRAFVAEPSYYLALCCYSSWNSLAIYTGERVVGFMMWAVDDDESCWLGGVLVDHRQQRRGYGRGALTEAMSMLGKNGGKTFALSYLPANIAGRRLYRKLGFVETGEMKDDEIVARRVVWP